MNYRNASAIKATLVVSSLLLCVAATVMHAQDNPRTVRSPEQLASSRIHNKLTGILIPKVEFHGTTLASAVEFLRQESVRLDPTSDPDSSTRGVNLILKLPPPSQPATPPAGAPAADAPGAAAPAIVPTANTRITLSMTRVPLLEVLKYVASQVGLKVKIEPYAVTLVPLAENSDVLVTRVFRVPPSLLGNNSQVGGDTPLDLPATAAH